MPREGDDRSARGAQGGAPRGQPPAPTRRARGVRTALGITALGLVLPGSGWLYAGRRRTGWSILACWLLLVLGAVWYATHPRSALSVAVDPTDLVVVSALLGVLILAWVAVLAGTYRLVRPTSLPRWHRRLGRVGVCGLCLLVATPLAVGIQYALMQRDLVNTVFADDASPTRPVVDTSDPWRGTDRVNVLLIGGDGGADRTGIRTDSMIVASVDTGTGDTTLFSVPRNLMDVPFPKSSPLHDVYPYGFTGAGDPAEWMLNAVYRNVPAQHPGILGASGNEGADALKLALTATLGIPVDYYVLVNLKGFEQIVDAIGGVTVNINQPIPVGGDTDRGIPPQDYLQPGPHQHLDGFDALWYSRGRYGLDDYNRMDRQRCMTKAIIDEVDPFTLLSRYRALAGAGKKIVRSDVPKKMLDAFVDLGLKVKDAEVDSVVFRPSENFRPSAPDFAWMHRTVRKALDDGNGTGNGTGNDTGNGNANRSGDDNSSDAAPADPCAYAPVG